MMPSSKKLRISKQAAPSDQMKSFTEAARALECDESEERFDEALKKVARQKSPTSSPEASDKPQVAGERAHRRGCD